MNASLFDRYFAYVEESEPPLVFHRWGLLTGLGALLGRQYYLPFGDSNIMPNMFVMLIGDPGTRKSTAIKMSKRVLSTAGYDKYAHQRTSKEKFLLDLEGIEDDTGAIVNSNSVMSNLFGDDFVGGEPKQVYIVADEFNEFVGSGNLEFLSLLGSLWDWDDPSQPFTQRLKTSRSVSIYQPTLSILGGNTHAGFAEAFPPQSLGQGFLSRLLLVYGEVSGKKIAFPKKPSDSIRDQLTAALMEIREKVVGPATFTPQAVNMLETIYRTFAGLDDARFKHYSTRRHTHLLKLCMLAAASNMRTVIQKEDVLFANTLLTFTEHKMPLAMGEFGKSKNADVAARLLAVMAEAGKPMDINELWKQVQTDLDRFDDLNKIMAGLVQGGKAQYVSRTKGSDAQGFLPVRKVLSNKALYCDFSLLKESKL